MRRAIAGAVCAGALVWWGLAVTAPSHHAEIGAAATSTPDLFDQRAFPCAEDEVLMYSPIFGPDRVGCVNWQEVEAALP